MTELPPPDAPKGEKMERYAQEDYYTADQMRAALAAGQAKTLPVVAIHIASGVTTLSIDNVKHATWERELSIAEVKVLIENPWCMFEVVTTTTPKATP